MISTIVCAFALSANAVTLQTEMNSGNEASPPSKMDAMEDKTIVKLHEVEDNLVNTARGQVNTVVHGGSEILGGLGVNVGQANEAKLANALKGYLENGARQVKNGVDEVVGEGFSEIESFAGDAGDVEKTASQAIHEGAHKVDHALFPIFKTLFKHLKGVEPTKEDDASFHAMLSNLEKNAAKKFQPVVNAGFHAVDDFVHPQLVSATA